MCVTIAGTETLELAAKVLNDAYGNVKVIPKVGLCLLSVGQLTDDVKIDENFKGAYCIITKKEVVIAIGIKGVEKLFRIKDVQRKKGHESCKHTVWH